MVRTCWLGLHDQPSIPLAAVMPAAFSSKCVSLTVWRLIPAIGPALLYRRPGNFVTIRTPVNAAPAPLLPVSRVLSYRPATWNVADAA